MAAETDREGILILLDVDNFKGINDRFGHLEGDKVLKRVTALLQATFRSDDVIGRLGGDEFIVFIRSGMQHEILEKRMRMFLSNLQEDEREPITCSARALPLCTRSSSPLNRVSVRRIWLCIRARKWARTTFAITPTIWRRKWAVRCKDCDCRIRVKTARAPSGARAVLVFPQRNRGKSGPPGRTVRRGRDQESEGGVWVHSVPTAERS